MQTLRSMLVIALISLSMLLCSCSKQQQEPIDFGKFENNVYSNNYFNMQISIPQSWYVMDDEMRIELMKKAVKTVVGDNENLQAVAKASDLKNLSLLLASEKPPGSPVASNPSLLVMAEKIKHLPGIKRGSDYHFATKKIFENSAVKPFYPREIYETSLGTLHFDVMDMTFKMGQTKYFQKQFAAIYKDYALLIALNYRDEAGLKKLEKVLQSVTFN